MTPNAITDEMERVGIDDYEVIGLAGAPTRVVVRRGGVPETMFVVHGRPRDFRRALSPDPKRIDWTLLHPKLIEMLADGSGRSQSQIARVLGVSVKALLRHAKANRLVVPRGNKGGDTRTVSVREARGLAPLRRPVRTYRSVRPVGLNEGVGA